MDQKIVMEHDKRMALVRHKGFMVNSLSRNIAGSRLFLLVFPVLYHEKCGSVPESSGKY